MGEEPGRPERNADKPDGQPRGAASAWGAESTRAMPGFEDPGAELVEIAETGPPEPPPSAFYAFRFPNFRLFFVGQLISVAGSWMQSVAQQWLVFELTKSAAWLGIVSGASAIPYIFFGLSGGRAADRYPRRTILVWTQAVFMGLAFVLTALASNRWVHIQAWHIAVLAAATGLVNAYNMPAQQAFVTDMVDERRALGNAIALNSLMFNLARFLGPIFAGALLVKLGATACFGLNGLSFIAVILSLLLMRLPRFEPRQHRQSPWAGFTFIWRDRSVLRTIALVGGAALFAWSFSTLFPVFADRFHSGARGYTGLMAANGIGAALGGLAMAWLGHRFTRRFLVYGTAILFCASLLLFTTAPSYWISAAWLVLCGFAMIAFGVNANTKVQEEVPDALRGRVMAVYSLVFLGLMPLGGLQIGFLAEHLGSVAAVRINAVLCLLVALALLGWSEVELRGQRRTRLAPAPGGE